MTMQVRQQVAESLAAHIRAWHGLGKDVKGDEAGTALVEEWQWQDVANTFHHRSIEQWQCNGYDIINYQFSTGHSFLLRWPWIFSCCNVAVSNVEKWKLSVSSELSVTLKQYQQVKSENKMV